MRSYRWIALVFVAASLLSLVAGDLFAGKPIKAPKPVYVSPAENFGYLPPPVDLKGLQAVIAPLSGQMSPPASWDWRALGGVTSVKNQNPYGTCWAFACMGDIESKVLIQESATNDYSEINVVACNAAGTTCNSGGNAWIVANYLSLLGTVNESCNAYPDGCPSPSCINPACTYLKMINEWRIIPEDEISIKNAIMTYGPVYSGIYASFSGFSTYNGTGCLQYSGTEDQNHAVLIVGWDDSMCGGSGGWIVKNSWGTSWGDNGYFYIKYGSARIGENVSVFTGYKDYDPTETIYHYDEYGWWSSVGYGDGDDWALVAFTPTDVPPEGSLLKAVDIWATWAPTNYSIEIYDEFDGTAPTSRLVGPITGTKTEAGYYSVALPTPLVVYSNDPIYIVVEFNTPDYDYPIPFDDSGPMETNKSYVSSTGTSGSWGALDAGNYEYGDIAVRARVEPQPAAAPCSWEGDPLWYYTFGYYEGLATAQPTTTFVYDIYAGQTEEWVIYWGNYGYATSCTAADTFCWSMSSKGGWTLADGGSQIAVNTPGVCGWGALKYAVIDVTAPCEASICDYDTIIASINYVNIAGNCAECGDCTNPDYRPSKGWYYYNRDTLILHVVEAPPALYVAQDTLTIVDRGQTAAYIAFQICNGDPCAPSIDYYYTITSLGHIGDALNKSAMIAVEGGKCGDVTGVIDASDATECDHDTLTIIAWPDGGAAYDTCVQVIHIVEPQTVPLFTKPVVTILVLALILVAAIFLRRRMKGGK